MNVTDKIAIVTGGGRGIGRAISHVLANNGADVVVADINEGDAQAVSGELDSLGRRSLAVGVDVTDNGSVDGLASQTLDAFGRIDIVVNNAGTIGAPGWEGRDRPNDDDWNYIHEVNVKGIARVTEAVAEHMKSRKYGKIVNIASVAGRVGTRTNFAYGASKAAAINLTRCYATEYAPYSINVNCVCPGLVWTKMWERIAQSTNRAEHRRGNDTPRVVRPLRADQHSSWQGADAGGDRERGGVPGVRSREGNHRPVPERGRRIHDELRHLFTLGASLHLANGEQRAVSS